MPASIFVINPGKQRLLPRNIAFRALRAKVSALIINPALDNLLRTLASRLYRGVSTAEGKTVVTLTPYLRISYHNDWPKLRKYAFVAP